jgi:predicted DNA-binding protein (MmcQ/YjbR family)
MTAVDADVPPAVLDRLRAVCLALPEAHEEAAWVGTRWRIRDRTFAHLLRVEAGWPPAYARAAGTDGPVTVVTFRSPEPEAHRGDRARRPFFWAGWGRDLVGYVLEDDAVDEEVAELLTESYCLLAPKALADRVRRP